SGVRGTLLVALVAGLAASITLAETTLVVLALWLVFGPRPAGTLRVRWPLLAPFVAFAVWTLVAALASDRPREGLLSSRRVLTLGAVRGAWVGFAVGGVGCTLGLRRRWLALAALVLVVAGAIAVEPRTLKRLRSVGDFNDDTTRDRLAMLETGLRVAGAHLITGIGPGQ